MRSTPPSRTSCPRREAQAYGARGGPERRTQIVELASGDEERNASWANSRRRYDVAYGIRRADDLAAVVAFLEERNGRLHGFRFKDWGDHKSCLPSGTPSPTDQAIGTGDGTTTAFQLVKRYASGAQSWTRSIAKPVTGTVRIALGGVEQPSGWSVDATTGLVTFGFTDHDRTLSFDGTDFEPESGLTSDRITETDILDGSWDNAEVEVWRVNWTDTSQRVLMRRGAIGQIRRGRLAFVAEVRSLAHVLGQTVGRTFQATCDAALGDSRCGVDLEDPAYKGTGAVIDLLRDRAFTASGLGGFTSGWFTFGTLEWTSGANAGRRTEVLGHDVTEGIAVLTLLEVPVRESPRATPSSSGRAATSGWRPAGRSSPTPLTSAASRISPARMPCFATPRKTVATKDPCCDHRRPDARHRHSAVLARHALPRSGQPARHRLRLPRSRLGRDRPARGPGRV